MSSPAANLAARPWMYSALRCDSPADRSLSMLAAATCEGVGNLFVAVVVVASAADAWSKRPMNRALMAFAAAPDTCWEMMPEARDSKGSIFSARPAGEKIRQWWAVIRGSMRGSTVSKGVSHCYERRPAS